MTKPLICLLAAWAFVAAIAPARADDQKDIQGAWKIEKAIRGGKDMPAEEREKTSLEFKDGKVLVHIGDRDEKPAEFKLDPKTTPRNISISPEGRDKSHLGIYELKGDTLKICFSLEDGNRPNEFESKEGSKIVLLVLKRTKK